MFENGRADDHDLLRQKFAKTERSWIAYGCVSADFRLPFCDSFAISTTGQIAEMDSLSPVKQIRVYVGQAFVEEQQKELRLRQLAAAMSLMQQALSLLDQAENADTSSVHLDLAIERLRDLMAKSTNSANPQSPG